MTDLDDGRGYYRDSFDYAFLFDELLPAVRTGSTGEFACRVADWERDSWQRASFVPPLGVVLIEGCFLLTRTRADAFDFRVWIELPLHDVIARALDRPRDLERMGGAQGVRRATSAATFPDSGCTSISTGHASALTWC